MKILDVFKFDFKGKMNILKQMDTYVYIISGIMFVIGIPFPKLNFLFYLSFIYLSYKLCKDSLTKNSMFYYLLPYFMVVGIWIWNEVFPQIFGVIPIGIILSILLCILVSNLAFLFFTNIKIKNGKLILLPAFFFLLDFAFQKIPYIKYIEMPIIIGNIYNHTFIIRLISIFGPYVSLFIIILLINTLAIIVTERKYNIKKISVIVLGILLILLSNYTVDSCVSKDNNGVRVSAVQPCISYGSLQYNTYEEKLKYTFSKYKELIVNQEADIFVFPENAVGLLDRENIEWQDSIDRVVDLAKEKNAYITALVIEGNSITKSKSERFITSLLVSPEGVVGKSSKRNLVPFGESTRYSKGTSYEVFNTKYGNIGISVCYDINSNTVEKLKRNGAQIILAPFNDSGFHKIFHNIHSYYPVIRALENNIPVIVANEDGISQIIDSNGTIIERLDVGERGVISTEFEIKTTDSIYIYFGKYVEIIMFVVFMSIFLTNILKRYSYFKKENSRV